MTRRYVRSEASEPGREAAARGPRDTAATHTMSLPEGHVVLLRAISCKGHATPPRTRLTLPPADLRRCDTPFYRRPSQRLADT